MIDEKTFVQNQYEKIHELDSNENPMNYFFYSNGIHFLTIKRGRGVYLLCGLGTGFAVKFRQSNFDVYETYENLTDAVKDFERFITLLLLPRRFESFTTPKAEKELF